MKKIYFISLLSVLFFFFCGKSYAQDIPGITITGIKGITKTVDEIKAFGQQWDQQNANLLFPEREELELPDELPGIGDENRRYSRWPINAPNTPASIAGVTQTIHSNFMATDFSTHSGGWPPDNNGDVGTTQVFIAQNFRFVVYSKPSVTAAAVTTPNGTSTTLLGSPAMNVSQNAFFQSAFAGVTTTDPHVRFDRLTSRWFIVSMSTNETTNNYLLFAVSSGATVTGSASFTFFRIQLSSFPAGNADIGKFLDYPTLGLDANSLYMGSNIFTTSTGSYSHSSAYVVDKSDMIGGTLTITPFSAIGTSAAPSGFHIRTPQGVQNDDPSATEGYIIGNSGFLSELCFRRVTYPGGVTTLSSETVIAVNTTASTLTQPALGSSGNLDASNTRLFAAMVMKNKISGTSTLWTAHTIQVNTSGVGSSSGGRNGCRWYQLQNITGTPTVAQSGTLFNDVATGSNPRGFWFPAIAMSGQGHSVLVASTASAVDRINIVVAGRYRTSTTGDLEDSTYATATGSDYNPFNGGNFVNRWGDYSQVGVDPQDNMTMWAFHQYCNTTNSYGVRAIQLKAPAPPAAVSAVGSPSNFCGSSVAVTLTGTSVANTEFFDPGADAGGPGFNRLTVTCSGSIPVSNVTFVSPTQVTCTINTSGKAAGTYTLTITNPDGQTTTATFTLSSSCVVPLTLLDFNGRLLNGETQLNWKTAQELNFNGFDVEKSIDGINFSLLQFVASKGSPNAETSYSLIDKKPYPGNTYYRLKMIDKDGSFRYSNIVLVKSPVKNIAVTNMFPNPAKDRFTVEVLADKKQEINIAVYDFAGRRVINQKKVTGAGLQQHQLNLDNFASGTYFVQVKDAAGKLIDKTKLVKE
jgi:hypothetical protein